MHRQSRAELQLKTTHADEKNTTPSSDSSAPLDCGDRVHLPRATRPSLQGVVRSRQPRVLSAALALSVALLFWLSADAFCPDLTDVFTFDAWSDHSAALTSRYVANASLEVFQVYPPVLTVAGNESLAVTDGSANGSVAVIPSRAPTCEETLVVHTFALSYSQPYVGPYTPPACDFNRVTWNLTVVSAGRQFDRLGTVSFGDIELFRTSTAEPTANGINWTHLKDMTNFLPLFKTKQKIIFDLGNLINDVYTAPFNVTLEAAYFTADDSIVPADLIVPISKRQGALGQTSVFQVPNDTAANAVTLPRNIKKAVFTIAATGQSQEEFWWSNVLQSQLGSFPSYGTLNGYSPFREVSLYINGQLAGVAWPFPVIFTGGVVPGLWRPMAGFDAFDLKEDEIDITPWLALLCDGNQHTFDIRISGLNDTTNGTASLSGTTGDYWLVTGKIFIWFDEPGHITTGSNVESDLPEPKFLLSSQVFKASNGSNETLVYQVDVQRELSLKSSIQLSDGSHTAFWTQRLSFWNSGNYTNQGNVQTNTQQTTGYDLSSSGYAKRYSYPLSVYSTQAYVRDNLTLSAVITRTKSVQTLGQPVFPTGLESFSAADAVHSHFKSLQGASLSTSQNGTAFYTANQTEKTFFSFGTTEQDMTFSGVRASLDVTERSFPKITQADELFKRHVIASNGSIVQDQETLIGRRVEHDHGRRPEEDDGHGLLLSALPGRGGLVRGFGQVVDGGGGRLP